LDTFALSMLSDWPRRCEAWPEPQDTVQDAAPVSGLQTASAVGIRTVRRVLKRNGGRMVRTTRTRRRQRGASAGGGFSAFPPVCTR